MSALLAAGWSRSSRHGVSVVPTIQCSPHGMTNSTLVGVRRISPACVPPGPGERRAPSIADRGSDQVHALGGPHLEARGGVARASTPMSSLHTPVAATTLRARTVNDGAVGQVGHPDADDRRVRRPSPSRSRPGHPGAGEHPGAVPGRGADDGERVPGVVHLGVPVADRPADDVAAQPGERRERRLPGQVPVARASPRPGVKAAPSTS